MTTLDKLNEGFTELDKARQSGDMEMVEIAAEMVAHLARVKRIEGAVKD